MPHKDPATRKAYRSAYLRRRRAGRYNPAQADTFDALVFPDPFSGCWLWMGGASKATGYGSFSPRGGRTEMAHRVAYERARGLVPDGLVIDHLCRVRLCVNPDHLQAVTQHVNVLRSRRARPRCGHEYTEANAQGHRRCSICARARTNRAAAKRRERKRGALVLTVRSIADLEAALR